MNAHQQLRRSAVTFLDSPRAAGGVDAVLRYFDGALGLLLALTLASEVGVMFANAMSRAFRGAALIWAPEIGNLALAVIVFAGAASAYRRGEHMAMHALVDRFSASTRRWFTAASEWAVFATSMSLGLLSLQLLPFAAETHSLSLSIPQSWPTWVMACGLFAIALFALVRLHPVGVVPVLGAGAIVSALALATFLAPRVWSPTTDEAGIVVAVVFVALLAIGVPIGFVFGAAALAYTQLANLGPASTIPYDTLQGGSGLLLLAIPLFILSGAIMTAGGLMVPLAKLVLLLVGRIRGGLLQVVVSTMYVFSGISGSKLADVAAVGSAMDGMFEKSEHSRGERAAVLAASAAMGETIPPSIGLLVLGSVTSLSIGSLFLAGIVPAAVVAVFLMGFIYVKARRRQEVAVAERAGLRTWLTVVIAAVPALLVPVILVGGIVGGIATPTDTSSFAVVYAVALAALVYRNVSPRTFGKLFVDAARLTGMLLFIVSTASAFSGVLTFALVPQRVATGLQDIAHDKGSFLLISILVLIVMGAVLEGLPAILVFGPLLLPVAAVYGVDPLQYGIVLLLALGIGSFAPPIGIGLYAACTVSRTTMEKAMRPMLPYLAVLLVGVVVVAFVPWFSLFLPHRFGP